MIIRAYIVDAKTKKLLKTYKRKSKEFKAEIMGKQYCKKHGEIMLEIISIGETVKTSEPIHIDKKTNLRLHFDSD